MDNKNEIINETFNTNPSNANVQEIPASKKRIPIIIGILSIIAIVILYVLLGIGGSRDFHKNKMISEIAAKAQESAAENSNVWVEDPWCVISSDGSYVTFDTQPTCSFPDKGKSWENHTLSFVLRSYYEKINSVNKELGFTDALIEKMRNTSWSMGRQTETNKKYTVSWTYHPDHGLEIMYEFNN